MMRRLIVQRLENYTSERVRGVPDGRHVRGDHDLNPCFPRKPPVMPAAVLVPLIDRAEGMSVLLTQRGEHLNDHAGQISFPGGRLEEVDSGPEAAALRETEEEVGLSPDRINLVGRLDVYETVTGYRVTPVVGIVEPPFQLSPDPFEVAEVFEVPLDFILDPVNHEKHERVQNGGRRYFYVFPYQDRYIWGATAGMLMNLVEVLRD